ncbi:hypothetical protein SPHINGOAX6_20118 [Sphingomonas sp. AX6]|nr:hypothetical protein SPHINGOAX6_20118 [Sphingomonas sp. AX6]
MRLRHRDERDIRDLASRYPGGGGNAILDRGQGSGGVVCLHGLRYRNRNASPPPPAPHLADD